MSLAVQGQTPDDAFHADGMAAFEAGRYDDAIELFKKTLLHDVDRVDTQFMLGVCYNRLQRYERAIDHYQIAVMLQPDHVTGWYNLARGRAQMGRVHEALSAIRQVRKHSDTPNHPPFLKILSQCIARLQNFDVTPQLVEELTTCIQSPDVQSRLLVPNVLSVFLKQAVVEKLLEHWDRGCFRDFPALLAEQSLHWTILNHPLFTSLMRTHTLANKEIELVLHGLRSHILMLAREDTLNDARLWPEALTFLCALAQHCFINEYVYETGAEEDAVVEALERRVLETAKPYDIALLACFKPLCFVGGLENLPENNAFMQIVPMAQLLRMQITEPRREREILGILKTFTDIDDEISLLVKQQYEANPYPRWVSTAIDQPATLRGQVQYLFPYLGDNELPDPALRPEALIAGCGTGRQSVENALVLPDAHFTAIDITAASLAYATRKTEERGLKNIEYGIADILKINTLGKRFDVIYCGGVLHHMRDPMAGWQALVDVLKPGGFMMVGLYSEIARRGIVAAREYIQQHGIEDSDAGIRQFRSEILNMPDAHPMKSLINFQDFYSLSECRDLLFHVQEHRFTALELRRSIDALGIRFLGFQPPLAPGTKERYSAMFPEDPHGLDLKSWHEYELKNLATFSGMYQFWLKKPA